MPNLKVREVIRLSFMAFVLVACTSWVWFPALAGAESKPKPVPFHFWATECIDQDCMKKGFRVWYEDHSISECICRDSKASGGPDSDCTKHGFFCETVKNSRP